MRPWCSNRISSASMMVLSRCAMALVEHVCVARGKPIDKTIDANALCRANRGRIADRRGQADVAQDVACEEENVLLHITDARSQPMDRHGTKNHAVARG